jgi:transposase
LAKRGYSRDGKPGAMRPVEFGLLTNADGAPLAIEAFAGNTADPGPFHGQVIKRARELPVRQFPRLP